MAGEDRERIARLEAGEEAAWEGLVREFTPQLMRYFRYHLPGRDEATAEDLAQETFACALGAMGRFDPQYTLAQFLFGIGRNRLIDHLRRLGHREALLPPTPLEEDAPGPAVGVLGRMASSRRSPAESVLAFEEAGRRRAALAGCLRQLVESLWEGGHFQQLAVLEFLLVLGGRNKDAVDRFGVESERAVAGIKFRALSRIRECLRSKDPGRTLFPGLWAPGAM